MNGFSQILLGMSAFRRAYKIGWNAAPYSVALAVLEAVLSGTLPWLIALATKELFDYMYMAVQSRDWTLEDLLLPIGLYAGSLTAARIASSISNIAQSTISNKVGYDVNVRVNSRIVKTKGIDDLENSEFLDGVGIGRMAGEQGAVQAIQTVTTVIKQAVVIGTLSWGILATVPVVIPLLIAMAAVEFFTLRTVTKWGMESQEQLGHRDRLASYFCSVLESAYYAPEIKALGIGEYFAERYREYRSASIKVILALVQRSTTLKLGSGVLADITRIVVLILVVRSIIIGDGTVGDLAYYMAAIPPLQDALLTLSSQAATGGEVSMQMHRFERAIRSLDVSIGTEKPHSKSNQVDDIMVSFRGVQFSYPHSANSNHFKLSIPDLILRRGQVTAIVGANGSGKSTLLKLILGLYEPSEGTIDWKGKNLSEWDIDAFRATTAYVSQNSGRYPLSVRDNIAFSGPFSAAEVDEALRMVGLSEVVRQMPMGTQTPLGTWANPRAISRDLSGGQWQRIGIARSLIRKDAELVAWDEATSSLDPVAERDVMVTLAQLKSTSAVCVCVTHRIASAEYADRILVMENGRIVEHGNHTDLVRLGGLYSDMVSAQEEVGGSLKVH